MNQEYEIKTYGTAKVVLEAGEYTVKDLIGIIEGMGQLKTWVRNKPTPIAGVVSARPRLNAEVKIDATP
jgi:hypothetical protein